MGRGSAVSPPLVLVSRSLPRLWCLPVVSPVSEVIISNPVCVDVIRGIEITQAFWDNIDVATSTKYPCYLLGITCVLFYLLPLGLGRPTPGYFDSDVMLIFVPDRLAWGMFTVCLLALMAIKVATTFRHRNREGNGLAFVLMRDSMVYCLMHVPGTLSSFTSTNSTHTDSSL